MVRNECLSIIPKNGICVELGVFEGDFSKEIYKICEPKKLYLVDLYPPSTSSGDKDGNNIKTLNLTETPIRLKEYFNDSSVVIIKSDTINFLNSIKEKGEIIDFIYIDADHTYDNVYNELTLSLSIVRNGGYICGHDYSEVYCNAVFRAVNDFCNVNNKKITMLSDDKLGSYFIKI